MNKLKKLLILLLCIGLLLPALASCEPDEEQSSIDESNAEPDPSVKATVDAFYIGEVDRTGERTPVTKSKSYIPSIEAGQENNWLDNGGMLTDGNYGTTDIFKEPMAWVGFVSGREFDIVVDLGALIEGICEFETTHIYIRAYAINLIPEVGVSASTDGNDYTFIGRLSLTDTVKDNNLYKYALYLKDGIKATHLKFTFKGVGGWTFIDELAAFNYNSAKNQDQDDTLYTLYPECKMPEITETEVWDKNIPDYNKEQNLILGLQPQIFSAVQLTGELKKLNSDIDSVLLTDGKYAPTNNYSDTEYFRMTRGVERNILFDLRKASAVSGYKISFCNYPEAAVNLPKTISVFVSENGNDWNRIERITGNEAKKGEKYTVQGDFDANYKARLVAVVMPVHTHLYCDEIEIIGKKNISGAKTAEGESTGVALYPYEYASPERLEDVHDVALMYNARNIESEKTEALKKGLITVDESLSYVCYRDTEGNIKDYMFDSFLYLPFGAFDHSTADGWHEYVENTFTKDYNIDALNTAVGKANQALGNKDYKAKVFLSVLRPNLRYDENGQLITFGDIDRDGVNEDFTKQEDRIKCQKWMIDESLRRFIDGNYVNLQLVGFYWYEEQISYDDPHELDMIESVVNYVHDMDYKLIWIPYFQASGFYDWNALGFDVACMQPNYFWKGYGNNVEENAIITKALGMCVEFEVDQAALSNNDYRKRYKSYLKSGVEYGYMKDTVHMYYISGGHGLLYDSYRSSDSFDRSIYDDTYKFIKGTLAPKAPKTPEVDPITCGINQKYTDGKIPIEENTYVVLKYAPKYGNLELNAKDGTFTYQPLEGFAGEDSFFIYLDNDYNQSECIEVTINVE